MVAVLHDHARAESDLVVRDLRDIDLRELAQPLAQLPQARLHELLALQRGLVLAVLAKVTHLDRFADLVGERDIQFELKLVGFQLQLFLQLFDHCKSARCKM